MLKFGLQPMTKYESSGKAWQCVCLKCGQISNPTLNRVSQNNTGCKFCTRKKNGLKRKLDDEKVVKEMNNAGFTPIEPYKSARSKWKCECRLCGRIQYPSYWNVRNSKTNLKGCAYCVGVKVDPKEVKELMLKAGLKPLEDYKSKDSRWKCLCLTCNRMVYPSWNNIRNGSGGCGYCRYIKSGKSNRTPEKEAIATMLKSNLLPLENYNNKDMPWKCKCLKCKNIVYPMAGNVKRGQGGCTYCRETGLNYSEAAYIYLIFHEEYDSIKVGVSNVNSKPNRLNQHKKNGWSVFKTLNFKSGRAAEIVETKTLQWLRKEMKLNRHLTADLMPQGGHSETVDASEISLLQIWQKIEDISKSRLYYSAND